LFDVYYIEYKVVTGATISTFSNFCERGKHLIIVEYTKRFFQWVTYKLKYVWCNLNDSFMLKCTMLEDT